MGGWHIHIHILHIAVNEFAVGGDGGAWHQKSPHSAATPAASPLVVLYVGHRHHPRARQPIGLFRCMSCAHQKSTITTTITINIVHWAVAVNQNLWFGSRDTIPITYVQTIIISVYIHIVHYYVRKPLWRVNTNSRIDFSGLSIWVIQFMPSELCGSRQAVELTGNEFRLQVKNGRDCYDWLGLRRNKLFSSYLALEWNFGLVKRD